jgi:hypothetical protein
MVKKGPARNRKLHAPGELQLELEGAVVYNDRSGTN